MAFTGPTVMLQTIVNLRAADVGFEKQNVLRPRVEFTPAEYPTLGNRFNSIVSCSSASAAFPASCRPA
jgi:hypothetical protein